MSAEPLAAPAVRPITGSYRRAKRILDVALASAALILLFPLMLGVALAIVVGSGGAPVFRQRRVGRFGREFRMWKFRTMGSDAEERRSELIVHSRESDWLHLDHDPRITRIGRVLRRTSLDELPQLLNVLRGDMSLVGPRPLPPVEHGHLPGWSMARLEVRPGLTGLWQVMGRTQLEFRDMLRLDCDYVRELSWRTDLKILIRTVPAVVTGRGAN
jgi:lipopolysaccharide/colanic/teichoic acid biosynthesis glycosyltransferase